MAGVSNMNWGQYPTIVINGSTYYLIQNIDDNLCLAINQYDTIADDESAGSLVPMYAILVQLDGQSNQ